MIRYQSDADSLKKTCREANMLARLSHPNIVRYFNSWAETAKVPLAEYKKFNLDSESEEVPLTCYLVATFTLLFQVHKCRDRKIRPKRVPQQKRRIWRRRRRRGRKLHRRRLSDSLPRSRRNQRTQLLIHTNGTVRQTHPEGRHRRQSLPKRSKTDEIFSRNLRRSRPHAPKQDHPSRLETRKYFPDLRGRDQNRGFWSVEADFSEERTGDF